MRNRSTCEDPLKQSPRDYSVLIESRTVMGVQARGVVGQRDGTRRNRGGSRRLDHKNKGKSLMKRDLSLPMDDCLRVTRIADGGWCFSNFFSIGWGLTLYAWYRHADSGKPFQDRNGNIRWVLRLQVPSAFWWRPAGEVERYFLRQSVRQRRYSIWN
jgi:hypothetical protein